MRHPHSSAHDKKDIVHDACMQFNNREIDHAHKQVVPRAVRSHGAGRAAHWDVESN